MKREDIALKQVEEKYWIIPVLKILGKNPNQEYSLKQIREELCNEDSSKGGWIHFTEGAQAEATGRTGEMVWERRIAVAISSHFEQVQDLITRDLVQKTYKITEEGRRFFFEHAPYFFFNAEGVTSIRSSSGTPNTRQESQFNIFVGPPGTGKTRLAKKRALSLDTAPVILQIHPSYTYEDLVEGLKPISFQDGQVRYDIVDGPLKVLSYKVQTNSFVRLLANVRTDKEKKQVKIYFPTGTTRKYGFSEVAIRTRSEDETVSKEILFPICEDTITTTIEDFMVVGGVQDDFKDSDNRFQNLYVRDPKWGVEIKNKVLILDEINRGSIPQFLGELLYSIADLESDERRPVCLQYSSSEFTWPAGLHLFGTMNSSDTSTDKLDQAVKRRFRIVNCNPDPSVFQLAEDSFGFLRDFNSRLKDLQDEEMPTVSHLDDLLTIFGGEKLSSVLILINNKLIENQLDYNLVNLNEKLLGHAYFIRLARLICESLPHGVVREDGVKLIEKMEYFARDKTMSVLREDVLPALITIFNHDEVAFKRFVCQELCPGVREDKFELLDLSSPETNADLVSKLFFKSVDKERREDFNKRKNFLKAVG